MRLRALQSGEHLDLGYFVEWHTWLWNPAVRAVLGDPDRFVGKRVLELGCGQGRMTCLFGLLGASVTGVELPGRSLTAAHAEVKKWNLEHQVTLKSYSGDLSQLTDRYDFVFSKSVLVIVPELERFLTGIATVLRDDGRLLAVENHQRGTALRRLKTRAVRFVTTGNCAGDWYSGFRGVTPTFMDTLRRQFDIVSYAEPFGLVAGIEARKRPTVTP